ncbi:methyltransferase domain-containing protein [Palleronia abyssalis]|uniref:Methyltransferase type 11 domain-containing protein n=1 Tax=Palleronia abyssalis TaxID=1501240 RepID=A0A2R8BSM8_9RHOB|nr:methyltransferase domain-containing protein [Palleronia abyssalis]SPJ23138.1 hypothetical protein PAA8504_00943 [Palleronia abyssalis]
MTADPPKLTDRPALLRRRDRTTRSGLFLHEIAADQVKERLEMVKRSFTDVAVVTGQPEFWSSQFPGATMIADTPTLDAEPASFDLVIHALALHWADDPIGQMVQSRRTLRPDGLFLSASFGGQTLSELRLSLSEAEANVRGGLSPRVAPMIDLRDAGGLLQRAGLSLPVADTERLTVSYADAFALMRELRGMGEANALASRDRRFAPRRMFDTAARIYRDKFPAADDPARIRATFELMHLSGWAPDDSQPKPLRPGSAKSRLADALRTDEHSLRDDSQQRGD